jgi:hypothetical protein
VISYCIACYRPAYSRRLIEELIRKTTVPYEILLWLNVVDAEFEAFLEELARGGAPVRVAGRSPENIGMAAYPSLFDAARFEMVAQIDDDVVCVSPDIGQRAKAIFDRFPQIGMLAADVWQDQYTNGARPPMSSYREVNRDFGLYAGPIDGWFAVYRRTSLAMFRGLKPGRYYPLGCAIRKRLQSVGQSGLLCTRMKVFHVIGPAYASYFDMLDSEIAKYAALGRQEIVNWYQAERERLPERDELRRHVEHIRESLERAPDGPIGY